MMNMLVAIKCKRCGKEIYTLRQPIHSSVSTMNKYRGICADCMSKEEEHEMMMSMNCDIKKFKII